MTVAVALTTAIEPSDPRVLRDRFPRTLPVRVVARRRFETRLEDPVVSVPSHYVKKPLLRGAIADHVRSRLRLRRNS